MCFFVMTPGSEDQQVIRYYKLVLLPIIFLDHFSLLYSIVGMSVPRCLQATPDSQTATNIAGDISVFQPSPPARSVVKRLEARPSFLRKCHKCCLQWFVPATLQDG